MKKLLILLLLLTPFAVIRAQVDSTVATSVEEAVMPVQVHTDSVADTNIPADARAYDEEADEGYRNPNKNPIYYFGSPFCEHFCEIQYVAGKGEIGIGIDYAYVPEVWGFHVSGYLGISNWWVAPGVDFRLSKPWNQKDWHLYGSAGVCIPHGDTNPIRPLAEVGVRYAGDGTWGNFCMRSAKVGVMTNFDGVFVTFGFSLSISLLATTFLLLGAI